MFEENSLICESMQSLAIIDFIRKLIVFLVGLHDPFKEHRTAEATRLIEMEANVGGHQAGV